jgi:hypothetical protein
MQAHGIGTVPYFPTQTARAAELKFVAERLTSSVLADFSVLKIESACRIEAAFGQSSAR